jgi:hypothetical protein
MRITIDEHTKLVHVCKGTVTLTLALPRTGTRRELEIAAEGMRAAFQDARVVVVNGQAMKL